VSRYVVTELEGFRTARTGRYRDRPGISCQVIDTAVNHELVATYRSEDHRGPWSHEVAREKARREAIRHALRLEAAL